MLLPRVFYFRFLVLGFILSPGLNPSAGFTQDLCKRLKNASNRIERYQCIYRASTFQDGKKTQTLMRYSYEKPGKIRMDIKKPRKGAVLIYNPEISKKVKIRPFPYLKFFILNYDLEDKTVKSGSGGTLDESDLGSRMRALCSQIHAATKKERIFKDDPSGWTIQILDDKSKEVRNFLIDSQGFLKKIEVRDARGNQIESFEWTRLDLDPKFEKNFFIKF